MKKFVVYLFFIPALVLLGKLLIKAIEAPITHDEALSYLNYSWQSVASIIRYAEHTSANNHLLNSLWLKGMRTLGLAHILALRLPALMGFLLCFWALWLLLKRANNYIRPVLCLVPLCNPFLLDFFVLARSYGLSFGLMCMAIALLVRGREKEQVKIGSLSLVLAVLSMLANFNLVYFFVPFSVLYFLFFSWPLPKLKENRLWVFGAAAIAATALVYVAKVGFKLQAMQQLYFGGNESFWSHVVNDQFWCFAYDTNFAFALGAYQTWRYLYALMLVLPLLLAAFKPLRQQPLLKQWLLVWFVFACAALLIELNHKLGGSLYPIKRTALFMTLLFSLNLMHGLLYLQQFKIVSKVIVVPVLLFCLGIWGHSLTAQPKEKFREIPYDYRNTAILEQFEHLRKKGEPVLDVSVNWQVYPAMEFYRQTRKLNWLPEFKREELRWDARVLYLFKEDIEKLDTLAYHLIWVDDKEGLYLYQRNE